MIWVDRFCPRCHHLRLRIWRHEWHGGSPLDPFVESTRLERPGAQMRCPTRRITEAAAEETLPANIYTHTTGNYWAIAIGTLATAAFERAAHALIHWDTLTGRAHSANNRQLLAATDTEAQTDTLTLALMYPSSGEHHLAGTGSSSHCWLNLQNTAALLSRPARRPHDWKAAEAVRPCVDLFIACRLQFSSPESAPTVSLTFGFCFPNRPQQMVDLIRICCCYFEAKSLGKKVNRAVRVTNAADSADVTVFNEKREEQPESNQAVIHRLTLTDSHLITANRSAQCEHLWDAYIGISMRAHHCTASTTKPLGRADWFAAVWLAFPTSINSPSKVWLALFLHRQA